MDDRQIIEDYVVESREHLADIENQLLAIEAGGEHVDGDLVNTVFRAVHSIKGAAGFFNFSAVQMLSHELENVLNLIRNHQLVPSAASIRFPRTENAMGKTSGTPAMTTAGFSCSRSWKRGPPRKMERCAISATHGGTRGNSPRARKPSRLPILLPGTG
jgi:HPt (histidine-containing phosphotransfer) domain-containing protein